MQGSVGYISWTVCYLAVLFGLSTYGVHRYFIIYLFLKHRKRAPQPASYFEQLPKVTVQLPIFNEVYVVERLLKSVSEIDYPRERMQIQVLDDSTDDTRELTAFSVEKLRDAGFNVELIHRSNRVGFKAGALETGLATAEGDFVCILDADFVPQPDLLQRTIHFFTDPTVGMIQTRWGHLNRGYSLLTRVQAMFLDGHLLLEQTARSRSGRFFNFNGTAGLWRTACIEEAGGWQHDTLTEDLDLSYRAQLAGWKFIFLQDVVTPAELPVDMNGFKSQQHRWTKGSIQTCKKLLPTIWRSNLTLPLKIEATAHLTSNFAYLLLACLCVLLHPSSGGPQNTWVRTLLIDVPIFLTASVSVAVFYICAQRELHPRTWMKEMLLLPCLLALGVGLSLNNARAVLEAVFNHQSDFARTPKYGIERKAQPWRKCKYMPLKSLLPLAEMAFALYFSYFVWYAIQHRQFLSVPFLVMFQIGFLYVSISSLAQWWPKFGLGTNVRDVAVTA
ncbi:MAG TPA: cellulose synthase family protein [Chthoniobacterales bacterium]|jgi:cellulose synthase/poly-beta-1,6-N-acetylglucosamine synthase-like glycosyltransferase|nr:cellulose synthase family protein [Chthoniobacterales bacterium]